MAEERAARRTPSAAAAPHSGDRSPSPGPRGRRVGVAVLLVALASGACTGDGGSTPQAAPTAAATAASEPVAETEEPEKAEESEETDDTGDGAATRTVEEWQTEDLPVAAGRPVSLEGAVGYLTHTTEADFELVVVDLDTGTVRFRLPSDPAGRIPGVEGTTGASPDGTIVYRWTMQEVDGQGDLTLHAHAVADGAELWTRAFPWASDAVSPCGEAICTTEWGDDGTQSRLRLDPRTGEEVSRGTKDLERRIWEEDEGRLRLSALADGEEHEPVELVRLTDEFGQSVLWDVDAETIAAGVGQMVTPNFGWDSRYTATDIIVYLGAVVGADRAGGLFALDRETGALRWGRADTPLCFDAHAQDSPVVGCQVEVVPAEDPAGWPTWTLTGFQGIDAATGETTWTVPLDEPMEWSPFWEVSVDLGDHRWTVPTAEGPRVLDLTSGELEEPRPTDMGVCEPHVEDGFSIQRPWNDEPTAYRPPSPSALCTPDGERVDTLEGLETYDEVDDFGVEAGDLRVWIDGDLGLRGARLGALDEA